ncbi:hypothetical protein [Marmoricola sp. URHB0036]|uniref:hypothetical protein n=1 Tax=Marmoricola sp. URHB0036 TaxID=1298863 RepID=UPI00047F27FA|nr:hypothetical protein [Marmoricola sp. URHB0036]
MTISIEPEDYLRPNAELQARWRARKLRSRDQADEFLIESNLLGLCGELAVVAFVRSQLSEGWTALHLADSSSTNSDISLVSGATTVGLEVKTTHPDRLAAYGRIVNEDQIYSTDADAYVWCVAKRSVRRPRVTILGWSTVGSVRAHWQSPTYTNSRPVTIDRQPWETLEDWREARVDRLDYDHDTDGYEYLQSATIPPHHTVQSVDAEADVPAQPTNAGIAFAEGAQPLPGFVRRQPLARVTADIRSVSHLIEALTGG